MYIFSFLLLVPLVPLVLSSNTYHLSDNNANKKNTKNNKSIKLDVDNVLSLRGEINQKLATEFVYSVNSRENKTDLYVYLDTNGGSVDAGLQIMDEIEKYELNCIAHKAMSMGFVILQTCKTRIVTPYSTIMQHQISYGIGNEKAKSGVVCGLYQTNWPSFEQNAGKTNRYLFKGVPSQNVQRLVALWTTSHQRKLCGYVVQGNLQSNSNQPNLCGGKNGQ